MLRKNGFSHGFFRHPKEDGWLSFHREIAPEIGLTVAVDLNNILNWNDFDNIEIIDEDFGQPYQPFFNYRENPQKYKSRLTYHSQFINKVVYGYEKTMDALVKNEVLTEIFASDANPKN